MNVTDIGNKTFVLSTSRISVAYSKRQGSLSSTFTSLSLLFSTNTLIVPLNHNLRIFKTMSPVRLAILDCDPLVESITRTYGSYGGLVQAFLQAGAEQMDLSISELEMTIWDVYSKSDYPKVEDIDAILCTGSSKGWNSVTILFF